MSKIEQTKVNSFIETYLFDRKQIELIIFLIDIRHSPTENDKIMYDYCISTELPFLVLCNKADKIAITKVDDTVSNLQQTLNPLKDISFLPFSSERKIYHEKVWNIIDKYIII